jgi:riboflavin kinase / FMN adenylyltransferase
VNSGVAGGHARSEKILPPSAEAGAKSNTGLTIASFLGDASRMRILHGYHDIPPTTRGAVLAIGNFDGVHRGHQAVLQSAMAHAKRLGRLAGAIVFEPHPREFLHPHKSHFRLTPLPRKLVLLENAGLDVVVVLPFDAALAALPEDVFAARVLVEGLGVSHVVIGYDFHYGKGRTGNPQTLRIAGLALGFAVTVVDPAADGGEVFSSSAVRAALARGDVHAAALILGQWWRLAGKVVGGAKRGTGLGYPTANVRLPRGTALGHGIFAVFVHHDGERHLAAAYLGTRPTFDAGEAVLEVFLFDFHGDLYGHDIEVEFIAFVRADAKFTSVEALQAQMDKDCAAARAILQVAPATPVPA